jgi:hypothetical protein
MNKRKTRKQLISKKFYPLIAKLPDGIQEQRPLIFEPRGEKMSVVLLDFMEPVLEFWETEGDLTNMLQFGAT